MSALYQSALVGSLIESATASNSVIQVPEHKRWVGQKGLLLQIAHLGIKRVDQFLSKAEPAGLHRPLSILGLV